VAGVGPAHLVGARRNRLRELGLPLLEGLLTPFELRHQGERLLGRTALTGSFALSAVGLRTHALFPRRQRGLAVSKRGFELRQTALGTGLACGDDFDPLLQARLHALDL